ncbi:L-threonylcarbamoyladenylate synthase [Parasporobacterium paucivorans]|uniref:Threonylcarbamoyl-AMP synthase n=1 Tax=Parasporobacterium paucivorans DSM 15970 TaxID=1122934 RepID=A0A1M6CPQ3_9FIRM|nr:L-threonylcarbamoyladenylate synthase [Parasporobacterium paucivorans]SHI62821.1 L-threonylcarbamoyladenylate synthase [Parasporobacterium paucivorans DSM 15970]
MNTKLIAVDPKNIDMNKIKQASEILRNGGLVAFPTETVYGLGADALNGEASRKIYEAKGRPSDNPLIIHIAEMNSLEFLVGEVNEDARILMEKFWPGPLTLIFKKTDRVPYSTTGGLETVAVRMPSHPVAIALIRDSGICIAAPSANTSGKPSPTKASHVLEDLNGRIDMVIDGGDVGIGLESTIVDMTGNVPVILRPGYVTREMMETVIGKVETDEQAKGASDDFRPRAPGMKYRHYAPKAELILVKGDAGHVSEKINELAKDEESQGKKVGIIATTEMERGYHYGTVITIGSRSDRETIARNLYSVLREFDNTDVETIYCEAIEGDNLGQAIMNRLKKASSNHIIQLDNDGEIEEQTW